MSDEQRPGTDAEAPIVSDANRDMAKSTALANEIHEGLLESQGRLRNARIQLMRLSVARAASGEYELARNRFTGASFLGGVAAGVASNSFGVGLAVGAGLKVASVGAEHLQRAQVDGQTQEAFESTLTIEEAVTGGMEKVTDALHEIRDRLPEDGQEPPAAN